MFASIVSATALQLTDAKGTHATLTYFRCPMPACPGVIIRLNALPLVHLGVLVTGRLCDALRQGSAWQELKPSEVVADLSLAVIRRPGGDEHFMLAYRKAEPEIAYFVVNGAEPSASGFRESVALDPAFRKELADRLTAELVVDQAARASA